MPPVKNAIVTEKTYEYGYYCAGTRVVLGAIDGSQYLTKKNEIDYANKIDPRSQWFLREADNA